MIIIQYGTPILNQNFMEWQLRVNPINITLSPPIVYSRSAFNSLLSGNSHRWIFWINSHSTAGWWFGTCLYFSRNIGFLIIPTEVHEFFRGVEPHPPSRRTLLSTLLRRRLSKQSRRSQRSQPRWNPLKRPIRCWAKWKISIEIGWSVNHGKWRSSWSPIYDYRWAMFHSRLSNKQWIIYIFFFWSMPCWSVGSCHSWPRFAEELKPPTTALFGVANFLGFPHCTLIWIVFPMFRDETK